MEGEIVNRVANSKLKIFDLEDYYPTNPLVCIDISQWLFQGFILKEKEFRQSLLNENWEQYKGAFIALECSTDAILPSWAFMLVGSYLQPFSQLVVQGTLEDLKMAYYQEKLQNLDFNIYKDEPVIIKGCSKKPIPDKAYVLAIQKIIPFAKSVMFGEACSAVPIFKRKKL